MEEFFSIIRKHIDERLSSPLMSSFVFAWCFWNYKFFIILFSDNTVSNTFKLAHEYCFSNWDDYVFKGFIFPLVSALLYIFLYPYPARYVYQFWLKTQRENQRLKLSVEDVALLSVEESRELRDLVRAKDAELHSKEEEFRQLVADKQAEVDRIRAGMHKVSTAESVEPAHNDKVIFDSTNRLSSDEEEVLTALGAEDAPKTRRTLGHLTLLSSLHFNYAFEELIEKGFISFGQQYSDGEPLFVLTKAARKYLIENQLLPT